MKQNKKGFTLMEVMVAVSVIIIGLTAALGLIAFTISSGAQDKEKLIAINLAQEGIELVRNIRDNNWKRIADGEIIDWYDGIRNKNNDRIDYKDDSLTNHCSDLLKLNEDDGYQYVTGDDTIYSRCIDTHGPVGPNHDKIRVISKVTIHSNKKGDYDVKVVAYLYDWKK